MGLPRTGWPGAGGLTSFSVSPLRWATAIGLFAASVGALFGLWIVIKAMMLGDATSGYPSLVAIISFLGGIQLLSIGIVGSMSVKPIWKRSSDRSTWPRRCWKVRLVSVSP